MATTKVGPTVQQLVTKRFHGNITTIWRNLQDSNREYLRIKKESSPSISISKCGLIVSVNNPWLGASPDQMVHNPISNPLDGLFEFKIPTRQGT